MSSKNSFVFVLEEENSEESRRFNNNVDVTNLTLKDLDEIVYSLFSDIAEEIFIYFKTSAGANTLLNTDADLADAIRVMSSPVYTFYIVKHLNTRGSSPLVHAGVICDECQENIVGLRYKCLYCSNYDLCKECESTGIHDHHIMLRISSPNSTVSNMLKFFHGMMKSEKPGGTQKVDDLVTNWMEENISQESREHMNKACKEAWKLGESIQSAAITAVTSAAKATTAAIETSKAVDTTTLQQGAENILAVMLASLTSLGAQANDYSKSASKLTEASLKECIDGNHGWKRFGSAESKQTLHSGSKINVGLRTLTSMGFTNDNGWLEKLLEAKNGDVAEVLNVIQRK